MPVLTPSRVAIVVLTLSLFSFLWTFGLPQQFAEPSLPQLNHDAPGNTNAGKGQFDNEPIEDFARPYLTPENSRPSLSVQPEKPIETGKVEETEKEDGKEIYGVTGEEDKHKEKGKEKEEEKQQFKEDKEKGKLPEDATHNPAPGEDDKKVEESDQQKQQFNEDKEKGKLPEDATHAPAPVQVTSALAPSPTAEVNATVTASVGQEKFCKDVPGAPDMMVIVKTSKAEIQDKLPTHLKTLLSCVPNFAIFSDHAGKIDGFIVHDALSGISNTTKASHPEFREYEKMQEDENYIPDGSMTKELDKWKFLPMVYQAHKLRPLSRFYIFIEADTSLSWTNLLQWMNRLDYRIAYYSGAPTYLNNVKFAQRGSGILLSYGALTQYTKTYDEKYENEWERRVSKECCGDMVLSTTLMESNVEFYSGFPLLQGETPSSLDWTERHWCAPIVSWHHMSPAEIEALWGVQTSWTSKNGWKLPHLFRDAFQNFILPLLEEKKDAWDNLSQDSKLVSTKKDPEKVKEKEEKDRLEEEKEQKQNQEAKAKAASNSNPKELEKPRSKELEKAALNRRDDAPVPKANDDIDNAADSADACKHLCSITMDCLQWKWTGAVEQQCYLGKVVRLGRKVEKKGSEDGWTSGWMMDKIKTTTEEWGNCDKVKWKFNQ
jgi:hypothetical protein